MSEEISGILSNRYSYDPLSNQNGFWKDAFGTVGGAFAGAVASSSGAGVLTTTFMGTAGTYAGREIGVAVDNASTLLNNAQSFVSEINDWRSWADALQTYGGSWQSY